MKDIREGDLYKTIVIGDRIFEIRYGYTSEEERGRWAPVPIYPDFIKTPQYTSDGCPFVTAYQDSCPHYHSKPMATEESWCSDCRHFEKCEEYIGICRCEKKSRADTPALRMAEMRHSIIPAEAKET